MINIGTFSSLKSLITTILTTVPASRSDDFILFINVVKEINPAICNMSLDDAFRHHNDLEIVSFESITRLRREIQKENPDLRANKFVTTGREQLESVFRQRYAN